MASRRTRLLPRTAVLLAVVLGACACSSAPPTWSPQGEGKLKKVTRKVTTKSQHRAEQSRTEGRSYRDDDDDGGFLTALFGDILGALFIRGVTFPFWLPHALMEERPGEMASGYFLEHPYAIPDEGYLGLFRRTKKMPRKAWSLRTAAEYGTDFDDIERTGVSAHLETAVRFGLDASWSHYREELPDASVDTLDMGDVNLTYRFAQASYGEMRAGLGMNWLADGPVDEYGFNFTYAGDFYLGDPWIASFEMDLGDLGEATRFHGRATFGAAWERCELCAGFDYESLDAVGLPSWFLGVRVWF